MRFISIRTVVAIVLLFALLFSTFPMSALANDTDNPEETAVTEDTATVESSKRAKYTTDPQKFEVIPTEKVTVEAETSPVESQEQDVQGSVVFACLKRLLTLKTRLQKKNKKFVYTFCLQSSKLSLTTDS